MLSTEELFKLFSSHEPRRIPVIPFVMQYAAKVAGVSYRDYCTRAEAMAEAQICCQEMFNYDAVNVSSDAHRLADALGGELDFPEDGVPVVKKSPVSASEDMDKMSVPNPYEAKRCRQRIKAIRLIKDYDPDITVFGWIEGALSDASSIFGPKNTLKSFYRNRDFLKKLFRFCSEFDRRFAQAQVEAGADIIGAGDSLASQVSTESFEFSVEYTTEIFRSLQVPTLYHVCGDTTHQLTVLRDSGADIVDLDRELDLVTAREILGPDMVIRGNIDPVRFVQGKPDEIRKLSLECKRDAGQDGPFILSAGCEIPPDSSRDNLEAMVDAARNYGK